MTDCDHTETDLLLDRVRAGEPAALGKLLGLHRAYLRRLVELHLCDCLRARVDASDVVQDTQLEAARRMDDYLERRPLPFRIWLRTTALNRLADAQRRHTAGKRNVRRDRSLPEHSSIALANRCSQESPTHRLSRGETAERVRQAIDGLAKLDREMILMRYYEELTNQEVAQLLQLEPATASKRYGRALRRLHTKLVDLGITKGR
jgi:RNA polymerase sigma-70 factor (ECF subfamily)